MIYDCFTYNGESEMLELRLGVIGGIADRVVIAESPVTHSGNPKPLTFNAKDSRFAPWAHKIEYIVVSDMPDSADRWVRERFQRDALMRGLKNCKGDDLVIVSDVDEIPDPDALRRGERGGYVSQISNYWLNAIEEGPVWVGPSVQYYSEAAAHGTNQCREHRYNFRRVSPGGWHFTWAMSEKQTIEKIRAFAHAEYDNKDGHDKILAARRSLKSFVTGNAMKVVDIDKGYFPQYLRDHRDRFQHLMLDVAAAPSAPVPRSEQDTIAEFHKLYYWSFVWDKNTKWMGFPAQQCPLDLWVFQEIIVETRPDLIIATGAGHGGSALFMAQVCEMVGNGHVIAIDHAEHRPRAEHNRLLYLLGSSVVAADVVDTVSGLALGSKSVMVVLDSDHKKDHVAEELRLYAHLVTPGSYLVVEGTNIDGRPIQHSFGPGPGIAVDEFLATHREFELDRSREKFLMTHNPGGYLRRLA